MKFAKTYVSNFEGAFRGMRNPLNSWERADSEFGIGDLDDFYDAEATVTDAWIKAEAKKRNLKIEEYDTEYENLYQKYDEWIENMGLIHISPRCCDYALIGPNDLNLAQRLIASGPEHCKFLRQIQVCVDISAPLYWWKEFDTYKIGTTANSTSTMHTLCKTPITKDNFAFDNNFLIINQDKSIDGEWELIFDDYIDDIVNMCETLRKKYNKTKDVGYWRALVQILPEAYIQTRTVTLSYANLRTIYFQRKNHKLKEWSQDFCKWIQSLPYNYELILYTGENSNENSKTN